MGAFQSNMLLHNDVDKVRQKERREQRRNNLAAMLNDFPGEELVRGFIIDSTTGKLTEVSE